MLKLSRYLYPAKYIEFSFYDAMVSKRDLKECLFWIYEVYYSGMKTDAFDLIYKCYFSFYAVLNPSLIETINKKEELWKENEDELIIGTIVKYLHTKKGNLDMFLMYRNIEKPLKKTLKRGPFPKSIRPYEPFHREIRSIHENNDESLLFDIKNMKPDVYQEFLMVVFKYFKNEKAIDYLDYPFIMSEVDGSHPFCIKYILFIIKFFRDFKKADKKRLMVSLNPAEIKYIIELKDFSGPLYNVLKTKRMYGISREFIKKYENSLNETNILSETRSNWKEHSKETPFWKKIFDSNCEKDQDFDFEFDEQPLECQQRSCLF